MNTHFRIAAFSLLILSSCAPKLTPEQVKAEALYHIVADRPVTCQAGDDCDKKWARAIEWVREHNVAYTKEGRKISYSINRLTSNVIQTGACPLPEAQFRILRFPREDGSYGIDYSSECDKSDECYRKNGMLLKMSFVSDLMGLPPGVHQKGPRNYSVDPEVLSKIQSQVRPVK